MIRDNQVMFNRFHILLDGAVTALSFVLSWMLMFMSPWSVYRPGVNALRASVYFQSLLLIVPGIIAAFRYSQAFAVLADHPEYSVGQCMGVSKQYMKMNKGKFFCLGLSFIGWALLASLPSSLAELAISLGPVPYLLISFVANIPNFFYMAYMLTAEIIFYELVSKNLVAAPKNKPMAMPTAEGLMEQPAALPVVEKQESEDDFQF